MENKASREVYGWLKLIDGTELHLDGQKLEDVVSLIGGRGIRTFRHPDCSEESNVYITNPDQGLDTLKQVRAFFKAQFPTEPVSMTGPAHFPGFKIPTRKA